MKKIGIIGAGGRMNNLVRLFINENPNISIEGVFDPDPESVNEFQKTYPTNVYEDYNKLIKDVDWVFIGSINSVHKEHILAAMRQNKNIFCEKPIAVSFEECREIKKEFDKRDTDFLISYPLRHSPFYKKVKGILDEGKIGKIVSMEFSEVLSFNHGSFIMGDWRRLKEYSGGHLLEKCCHDFDIVNWLVEDLPKKVSSFGGLNIFKSENSGLFEYLDASKGDYNPEKTRNPFNSKKDITDNQMVIMEYNNGVRASFHTNLSSALPERRMYICGTKGTMEIDLLSGLIQSKTIGSSEKTTTIDEKNRGGHGGGDPYLVRDVINVIEGGEPSIKDQLDKSIISAVTCISADKARKEEKITNLNPYWEELGYVNMFSVSQENRD